MYGQRLLPDWLSWWPFLCGLKVMSLALSQTDRLYQNMILANGKADVLPTVPNHTGKYMVAAGTKFHKSVSLNLGIKYSTGEFIAFVDHLNAIKCFLLAGLLDPFRSGKVILLEKLH